MKLRKQIRRILHPFYKKYHFWYHSKPRRYYYKNVWTMIQPTVFSPKNTVSTKIFLNYLNTLDLENKSVLELGCGSGIISLFCASKNAKVVASDINELALDSLTSSSKDQDLKIECIYSDLFDNIPKTKFDYILINPPYYPKTPKNIEEKAWFCGEDFEYFKKLFLQLPNQLTETTNCLLILSEDCEINSIHNIASKDALSLKKTSKTSTLFETNYIFKITG